MNDEIVVKWGVNVSEGVERISMDQLSCETIEEWNSLSRGEQLHRIQCSLTELDRVYIVFDEILN
jgi:hypothetical protein